MSGAAMTADRREATFYFDTISPFAYLMWKALRRAPLDVPVTPVPVVFGALLNHWGQLGPAEVPAKRIHTYRYCQWLAEVEGIPFRFPPTHPFLSLGSLRLIVALGSTSAAVDEIFDRIFAQGRDLSSADELARACKELAVPHLASQINAEPVKAALRRNTDAAIERGVFGVPTLAIGDELFWGYDSLAMARDFLANPALFDDSEMQRLDALPFGVTRNRR
jgi:2-hydroxychromene-2-carboxylate isomerase